MLSEFIHTYPGCVFALVNHVDKRVIIYKTEDFHHQLGYICSELLNGRGIEQMREDYDKLEVEILTEVNDEIMLRLYKHYYADMYLDQGYSLYSNRRDMLLKVDYEIHPNGIVQVSLVCISKKNRRYIVGLFDTEEEAQEFIRYSYYNKSNRYCYPVFATNARTRKYMLASPVAQECTARGYRFKVKDKVFKTKQSLIEAQ